MCAIVCVRVHVHVCVWVTPWARQWKLCIFHETSLKMDGRRQRREVRDEGGGGQTSPGHSFFHSQLWGFSFFLVVAFLTPSIWTRRLQTVGIISVLRECAVQTL